MRASILDTRMALEERKLEKFEVAGNYFSIFSGCPCRLSVSLAKCSLYT